MTDLTTLANLAEIFGAVVVVGGLGFGVVQLHNYRQQRRETAAIELLRSFHNPEFSRALRVVLDIPVGARKKDLGECSADQENRDHGRDAHIRIDRSNGVPQYRASRVW